MREQHWSSSTRKSEDDDAPGPRHIEVWQSPFLVLLLRTPIRRKKALALWLALWPPELGFPVLLMAQTIIAFEAPGAGTVSVRVPKP